jgi:hypothetical protein
MRRNPQGDWTIKDVQTVCDQYGLILRSPKRGGHYTAYKPGVRIILTIPFHRPIKTVYIRRLVTFIDLNKVAGK